MLLTGNQIRSLSDVSDGSNCRLTKLPGELSGWVRITTLDAMKIIVWISPEGQILDKAPVSI